jgi:hypothetical protein
VAFVPEEKASPMSDPAPRHSDPPKIIDPNRGIATPEFNALLHTPNFVSAVCGDDGDE